MGSREFVNERDFNILRRPSGRSPAEEMVEYRVEIKHGISFYITGGGNTDGDMGYGEKAGRHFSVTGGISKRLGADGGGEV